VLDGMTAFSESTAQALLQHPMRRLSLNGLTLLSDAAARSLGRHVGVVLAASRGSTAARPEDDLVNRGGQLLPLHMLNPQGS